MSREKRRNVVGVGFGLGLTILLAFPGAARAKSLPPNPPGWVALEISSLWYRALDGLRGLWDQSATEDPVGMQEASVPPPNGEAGAERGSGIDLNG